MNRPSVTTVVIFQLVRDGLVMFLYVRCSVADAIVGATLVVALIIVHSVVIV